MLEKACVAKELTVSSIERRKHPSLGKAPPPPKLETPSFVAVLPLEQY